MRNSTLVLCLFLCSTTSDAEELPPPPNYKAYVHQQTLKQQYQAYLAYKQQQTYQRSLSFKPKQQQKSPRFLKTPTSPLPDLFQNETKKMPLQKRFKPLNKKDLNPLPFDNQQQPSKNKLLLSIRKKPIKQPKPQTGEAQFRPLDVPFTP